MISACLPHLSRQVWVSVYPVEVGLGVAWVPVLGRPELDRTRPQDRYEFQSCVACPKLEQAEIDVDLVQKPAYQLARSRTDLLLPRRAIASRDPGTDEYFATLIEYL